MKRTGYLFEKVADFGALRQAAYRAAKGKRLSREGAEFMVHLESEVLRLEKELEEGTYKPGSYRTFTIYERKPRRICAAPFRDRVVHHALCAALEPSLESYAIFDSYACRPGKGSHQALQRVRYFSRREDYFLKTDIARYFDTINHNILKGLLQRRFKDGRLLALLEQIIDHGPPGMEPGKALPIGNLTSQRARYRGYQQGEITEERFLRSAQSLLGHISHAGTRRLRRSFFQRLLS